MEVSSLRSGHFTGRNRQGSGSWLANEKNHQISAFRGLPVGHVNVLAFHFSLLRPANVRAGEQDLLYFVSADAVLLFDLGNELVIPDDIVKAQMKRS
jgi:hypothetical protein